MPIAPGLLKPHALLDTLSMPSIRKLDNTFVQRVPARWPVHAVLQDGRTCDNQQAAIGLQKTH